MKPDLEWGLGWGLSWRKWGWIGFGILGAAQLGLGPGAGACVGWLVLGFGVAAVLLRRADFLYKETMQVFRTYLQTRHPKP